MIPGIAALIHAAAALAAVPLLLVLVALAATLGDAAGRTDHAPAMQPLRDLRRLWRKTAPVPDGSSIVFAAAPSASLAAAGAAAMLVPGVALGVGARWADLVVVGALIALSRALLALSAFDAGSALATAAGQRAMRAMVHAAAVLFPAGLVLAILSGGANLDQAGAAIRDGGTEARFAGLLCGAAMLLVAWRGEPEPGGVHGGAQGALLTLAAGLRLVAAAGAVACVAVPYLAAGAESGVFGWVLGAVAWALKLAVLGPAIVLASRWSEGWIAALLLLAAAIAVASVPGAA